MTAWIVEWDGCPAWLKNGIRTLYDWWTLEKVHKVVENVDLVVCPFLSLLIW